MNTSQGAMTVFSGREGNRRLASHWPCVTPRPISLIHLYWLKSVP